MSVVARALPPQIPASPGRRRPKWAPASLFLALLVIVALGTGCGVDPAQYVDKVNKEQTAFAATINRLQAEIKPTSSVSEDLATLTRFEKAIALVVKKLKAIEAPDDAADLHQDLIDEISKYGTTIRQAKAKFASNSPQAILAAQTELSTSVARTAAQINITIDKINDKLH
jgi:hypothetical protein